MPARLAVAAAAGVVIVTAAGCGAHRHPAGSPHPSGQPAAMILPASGSPVIGVRYFYKLFVHCGVTRVTFGGRSWQPVKPVARYPGARPVNGITTETGYVAGTMRLVNAHALRFTANPRGVLAPFTVMFRPAATSGTARPCA
ncbi:MAG TPA: hypothetical protein VF834_13705 [Streptosporangiaceae bacterium]